MIYDCFTFFNELDLLELRLEELSGVVDKFVIIESPVTFSGRPKPLYLRENQARFQKWWTKIEYASVELPATDDPWTRETAQRNALNTLIAPNDSDILTLSDCDEIPHPSVYSRFQGGIAALRMPMFHYYINCLHSMSWIHGRIVSGEEFKKRSFQDLRYGIKHEDLPAIWPGGWHFSWLGTADQLIEKAKSSAHCNDHGTASFIHQLRLDKDMEVRAGKSRALTIDKTWPQSMVNNFLKWEHRYVSPFATQQAAINSSIKTGA